MESDSSSVSRHDSRVTYSAGYANNAGLNVIQNSVRTKKDAQVPVAPSAWQQPVLGLECDELSTKRRILQYYDGRDRGDDDFLETKRIADTTTVKTSQASNVCEMKFQSGLTEQFTMQDDIQMPRMGLFSVSNGPKSKFALYLTKKRDGSYGCRTGGETIPETSTWNREVVEQKCIDLNERCVGYYDNGSDANRWFVATDKLPTPGQCDQVVTQQPGSSNPVPKFPYFYKKN